MKKTATTIKIREDLYADFKVLGVRHRMTLQDFAERCVYLFVNNKDWRESFNGQFAPSGSINLSIFDKNYTGSISQ